MTESPAEVRYRAFQRLRSSFNSENTDKEARTALHHEHKKENSETWKKIDNHSEARLSVAHLISLVEEGNSLLQTLSPVRGYYIMLQHLCLSIVDGTVI